MKVSEKGWAEIRASEGWSSRPYLDRIARPPVWTIGFGETNGVGPNTGPWSLAQGTANLVSRFNKSYAWALKPFVTLKGFTQNMYDALASFVWNCGTGAVSASTKVGRHLRAKRWGAAANALLEWSNAGGKRIPGLYARRQRERRIFLTRIVVKVVRAIKLTATEKFHVDRLRAKRRIADRHGGWDEVDEMHHEQASVSKAWLRKHATAYSVAQIKDTKYQARKVDYLRDVALDRDGRGR